jgi:hypothetical protein
MVGGFHIYATGGTWEPRQWLRGRLDGESYFATKAELRDAAARAGRTLRKHRDYFQLRSEA